MRDEFEGMTDAEIKQFILSQGFIQTRKLPDGSWIGLLRLAFSMSVCVGIGRIQSFTYRWCFNDNISAQIFYASCEHLKEVPNEDLHDSLVGHRHTSTALLILQDEHGFDKWK